MMKIEEIAELAQILSSMKDLTRELDEALRAKNAEKIILVKKEMQKMQEQINRRI